MTKDDLIQERLGQIRSTIESRHQSLSLLLPEESCAMSPLRGSQSLRGNNSLRDNHSLRDNDCDIQFTLLVKNGAKEQYLRDLSWLMDIQHIAFKFCRSPGHFRFLFSDGIYCDLTVMDEFEIASQKPLTLHATSQPKTGQADATFSRSIAQSVNTDNPFEKPDEEWLMGEMLTNLLIGLRRFNKGDKLSAFYLIQHHALSRLLTLIAIWEVCQETAKTRTGNSAESFEQTYPQVASQVAHFALGYDQSPQSAFAMLKYVEQHENVNYFLKDQLLNLIQPHSNLH